MDISTYKAIVTEDCSPYSDVLEAKLVNLECKHMIDLTNEKAYHMWSLANSAGYGNILWGYATGASKINEKRKIENMCSPDFKRPMRVVIDKDKRLWADNTHTCISNIIKFGTNVKVKDVPFYIFDYSRSEPVILNYNNSFVETPENLNNVCKNSLFLIQRINAGIRPKNTSWKIHELIENCDIALKISLPKVMN